MPNQLVKRTAARIVTELIAINSVYWLILWLVPDPLCTPLALAWATAGFLYMIVETVKCFRR